MDQQTALKRIVMEVHKENPEDLTLATLALLKAFEFYTPHRFPFNERAEAGSLVTGQAVYPREDLWPNLERIDSLWLLRNQRWEKMEPLHSNQFVFLLHPEDATNDFPRRWTWYEDSLHVDPAPDQDYDLKTLYVRRTDVPTAAWDGTTWIYSKAAGDPWLDTDTCEMLTHAPELCIARAKWDLYFNVYDDNENAQKMQLLVDLEYNRLGKRLTNMKAHVRRTPTHI